MKKELWFVVIIIAVNKEIVSIKRQLLIGQSEVYILVFGFVLLVRLRITECVKSEAYIPMPTIVLFVRLTITGCDQVRLTFKYSDLCSL